VGALPYLYKLIPEKTPLFLSSFTAELVKNKLKDHGFSLDKFQVRIIDENMIFQHGDFQVQIFFMPHSIPQAFSVGLTLKKPDLKIFYTGDFKTKGAEKEFKENDLKKFGPVDMLFCDSTGALFTGYSENELNIIKNLEKTIKEWEGRVFVTTFSSHIQRIKALFQIAEKTGRQIGILGYSMKNHLKAAFESDNFDIPPEKIKNPSVKNEKVLWLIAGCQAEDGSSLNKLSTKEIERFNINENDLIIYSASMIPGNEESIYEALNEFSEKGAYIKGLSGEKLHASGHGRQEDILNLFQMLSPKNVIPIHGDPLHFYAFRDLINQSRKKISLHIVKTGGIYELEKEVNEVLSVNSSLYFVENGEIHSDIVLYHRRRELSKDGICNLVIDKKDYNLKNLNYVGCISEEMYHNKVENLKIEISFQLEIIAKLETDKKEKRIKEKVYKINKLLLKKAPFVNILWV